VSKGRNILKTHPSLAKRGYYSTHAECMALMKANEGDTLIVVRIHKDGAFSCSKPCERCLILAKEYGIKRIFYTDWDASLKEIVLT
jgi:deoxycytidylate deaminase